MACKFNDTDVAILRIVQKNLPDSLTPYADIAKAAGVDEEYVLKLLRDLKAAGAIRRFGASLRHQKTGWNFNAMVAWVATPEQADICAPKAAEHPAISHVYYRPSAATDWPFTFYTMIHGRSEQECLAVVDSLAGSWPIKEYAILKSTRELKKISMTYFP